MKRGFLEGHVSRDQIGVPKCDTRSRVSNVSVFLCGVVYFGTALLGWVGFGAEVLQHDVHAHMIES